MDHCNPLANKVSLVVSTDEQSKIQNIPERWLHIIPMEVISVALGSLKSALPVVPLGVMEFVAP